MTKPFKEGPQIVGALCRTTSNASVFVSYDTEELGFLIGSREYHMKNPSALDLLLFWDSSLQSAMKGQILYESMQNKGLDIIEIVSFLKSNGSWQGVE